MLDTNAVAALVKARSPALENYVRGRAVCISVVTEAEVLYGLARRPAGMALRRVVEGLLAMVEIMPWDSDCAAAYANVRAQLETLGKPLAPMDTLIAAHSLAVRCPLVTADRAFTQVPDLSVVQWSADSVMEIPERSAKRVRIKLVGAGVAPRDVERAVAQPRKPRAAKSKAKLRKKTKSR